jgi:predicted heme/steroid binding protein
LGTALEFFTPSYLTPVDIIATTPLVWNSGTKTMSIPVANNTTDGYLSSADWLTFSSKQPAITLTTTGNSGPSTFNVITGALNVPEYTLLGLGGFYNPMTTTGDIIVARSTGEAFRFGGNITTTRKFFSQIGDGSAVTSSSWYEITTSDLGAVPTSRTLTINGTAYDLTANRSWSVGTVTSIGLSSTTSGITIASTPVTSSGTITIDIATASGSSNGLLSSTDWTTFNSKLNNPFSALGQMIYSNAIGAALVVAPNTTTTRQFLSMTGTGTVGAAPQWNTISVSDVTGAIGLTSLSATSPLLYNNSTGVFSIQLATSLQNGYLSSSDWIVFNLKQDAITLTTTGNNGAASLIGSTLNIPEYTLSGLGGFANPMTTTGDIIVARSTGEAFRFGGNITTTRKFFSQIGNGSAVTSSSWYEITTSDIGAVPTSRTLTINGTAYDLSADRSWSIGTVTSVALSVPTGLTITGSPITGSGTLAIGLQSGYSIPTTASQTNWDAAYNDKINSASVSGTTTKTLTLNQQDGGTITASWTDINTDAVTSVFGRTGAVVATNGDYNTSQVTENVANLYFTNARARSAISLTTTGSSGSSTYDSGTGVLNVPTYTATGLGAVPTTRTLTINDVPFDLSADRNWSVGDFGTW